MKGFIALDSVSNVFFSFGATLPELEGKSVLFRVEKVISWGQRNEPTVGTLIGYSASPFESWKSAVAGETYDKLGIYLGNQMVLTAELEG